MKEKELQEHIDVAKWFLSEEKRFDMCGNYDYCAFCEMKEENPCANAMLRKEKANKPKTEIGENGYPTNVVIRSLEEKLQDADQLTNERYEQIKAELLSYKKVNHRVSKKCDNYRAGRGNLLAKITLVGKSLRINFPLDTNDIKYEGRKFPHKDLGNKKAYMDAPFQFKITSELSVRRCFALIEDVMTEKSIEKKTKK
ncbi:MAG: hypothetical protein PHE93_01555 [Clostridia bacterium]|nr:hypothetical protein [Clostridia bacterium]